jgi:hypothetical protein|tara:strand:+ start:11822 stop:12028 length:207 start_codon:yes stop_codon:yes gene_type:complete
MEIKFTQGNQSMTLKTDGESIGDAIELAQKVIGWAFEQVIELQLVEEEDNNIYCEGIEPSEEREIDGL